MKQILFTLLLVLSINSALAVTIETTTERDTVYEHVYGPMRVNGSFGKMFKGDYGVFLHIRFRGGEGEDRNETLFYRLNSYVLKEDKNLLTILDDGTVLLLAKKKWYGWKKDKGITIKHSMERTPYPTFKVWLETN